MVPLFKHCTERTSYFKPFFFFSQLLIQGISINLVYADCPSCFELIGAKITLDSGESLEGYITTFNFDDKESKIIF